MLREVKSKPLKNRITYFNVTTTSTPSITANIGKGNLGSISRTGGLTAQNPLRLASRQNIVWIASQSNNNGGFVSDEGGATTNTLSYKILDNAASVTDGTADVFAISTDSPTIDALPLSNVICETDRTRYIWGRITSAGVVALGASDFSCTKTATGTYSITYKNAFKRTALAFATPIATSYRGIKISSKTATGCVISIHEGTPTALDTPFYILAIGTDSIEETTRVRNPLLNSQRKPRTECFQYTVTGGAETVTVGSKIATLTNNGTGDNTITLAEPFKREFATFALSGPGAAKVNAIVQATNSSSATRVQTIGVASVLTDPSGGSAVHVIMVGSMDPSEY